MWPSIKHKSICSFSHSFVLGVVFFLFLVFAVTLSLWHSVICLYETRFIQVFFPSYFSDVKSYELIPGSPGCWSAPTSHGAAKSRLRLKSGQLCQLVHHMSSSLQCPNLKVINQSLERPFSWTTVFFFPSRLNRCFDNIIHLNRKGWYLLSINVSCVKTYDLCQYYLFYYSKQRYHFSSDLGNVNIDLWYHVEVTSLFFPMDEKSRPLTEHMSHSRITYIKHTHTHSFNIYIYIYIILTRIIILSFHWYEYDAPIIWGLICDQGLTRCLCCDYHVTITHKPDRKIMPAGSFEFCLEKRET